MATSIPDHPVIQNMEQTGYPDGRNPEYPYCPVCGAECETVYLNDQKEIIGCDICISAADAWKQPECFSKEE